MSLIGGTMLIRRDSNFVTSAIRLFPATTPKIGTSSKQSRCGPFTPRRIQQIVQAYRAQAGITQPVHTHLFRHQMISYQKIRVNLREPGG
jgi:hypothetical protein